MRLTMKERRAVTQELVERYRKAAKKQKRRILDEFTALTSYHRCYAAHQLGRHGKQVRIGRVQLLAPLRVKPLACRGPDATTPMCSKCSSRFGALWIILVANALARCRWKTNLNGERVMRWASSCVRSAPHLVNIVRGTSIPPTASTT